MDNDFPMRMTEQRRLIMEELRGTRSHPTAEDLYKAVRKRLPKISLGTVYRNLEAMSACGLIRKLETPGGRMRFDADTSPHFHVRCARCGRVGDVYVRGTAPALDLDALESDFRITGYDLEFTGLCPECAAKTKKN